VRSKYDSYWAGRLEEIRLAVELAAAGSAATVGVLGLRRLGNRQSWSGVAEVRGCELTRASGAHAKSLGNTVTASGICSLWEEVTFRLVTGSFIGQSSIACWTSWLSGSANRSAAGLHRLRAMA
jgi:hypothetical protein